MYYERKFSRLTITQVTIELSNKLCIIFVPCLHLKGKQQELLASALDHHRLRLVCNLRLELKSPMCYGISVSKLIHLI